MEGPHRQLTSSFIGQRLKHAIAKQPTQSASQLEDYISMIFEYNVDYGKAWRAKQMALKMVYGDWEESYGLLPKQLQAINARNPGMVYEVEGYPHKTPEGRDRRFTVFRRSFWAFGASIEAYRHFKPVLSIDGTFLSSKVRGMLLVAITCDADNQLVPLAFDLVEREDNSEGNMP
ncbi:uncharacterized protein [Aegilops tauschii subsp. strangulata]|uniref:uncharacterized protein n=1 Tax=Aegilops tauschii subsp. strangulata TaxID=200361 RepID=UPI003CC8704C